MVNVKTKNSTFHDISISEEVAVFQSMQQYGFSDSLILDAYDSKQHMVLVCHSFCLRKVFKSVYVYVLL